MKPSTARVCNTPGFPVHNSGGFRLAGSPSTAKSHSFYPNGMRTVYHRREGLSNDPAINPLAPGRKPCYNTLERKEGRPPCE